MRARLICWLTLLPSVRWFDCLLGFFNKGVCEGTKALKQHQSTVSTPEATQLATQWPSGKVGFAAQFLQFWNDANWVVWYSSTSREEKCVQRARKCVSRHSESYTYARTYVLQRGNAPNRPEMPHTGLLPLGWGSCSSRRFSWLKWALK